MNPAERLLAQFLAWPRRRDPEARIADAVAMLAEAIAEADGRPDQVGIAIQIADFADDLREPIRPGFSGVMGQSRIK